MSPPAQSVVLAVPREVIYSNLGPGSYRFPIIACDRDEIYKSALPWQRSPFRAVVAPSHAIRAATYEEVEQALEAMRGHDRTSVIVVEVAKQLAQPITRTQEPTRYKQQGERMMDQMRLRILSVDDHPLVREGIAKVINDQPDMVVVAQAANGNDAIQMFREHRPDVTLLDLRLPDMSGIDVLLTIRAESCDARIVMLTTAEGDVEIQRALEAGAMGYMLKSMSPRELTEGIRLVHLGKKFVPPVVAAQIAEHMSDEDLTPRELEVLRHVAGGNRNRDIGEMLFISEETVKAHVKHIMEKLGANDRTQAIAIAVRRGIMQL